MTDALPIWTIYDHPRDYPTGFIARKFLLDQPTDETIAAPTRNPRGDVAPRPDAAASLPRRRLGHCGDVDMSAERRALLLALLQHHQELPPVDISDLSGTEKLDAIVMCCSELITDAIWIMSQCDEADAIKGIDALMTDIKANIKKRPALGRPMP